MLTDRPRAIAEFILARTRTYMPAMEAEAFDRWPDLTVSEWAAALAIVAEVLTRPTPPAGPSAQATAASCEVAAPE